MVERDYFHPNNRVMREFFASNQAAGTAARYRPVQPIKLKAVYGVVTTAATNAAATMIPRTGTTAIAGTTTVGTATAGSTFSQTGLNVEVASLALLNCLTDHALSADLTYVFQVDEDNTVI